MSKQTLRAASRPVPFSSHLPAAKYLHDRSSWSQHRLTDVAHYHNGVAFKPANWSTEGLPIIRIEQLNNPNGDFDRYGGPVSEVNRIRDGDLVFSWSATLKVIMWRNGDAVLNQHLFKVVARPGFDTRFLLFLLDYNMDALGSSSHGSTMKHIRRGELDKFVVWLPELARQKKIAAILGAIGTAIEKTEALIAKYQQIKAGLMHDLFTRGVLPNGQLRPPRSEAPELYQETAIGWIPRGWRLISLRDLVGAGNIVNGPFGSDLLTSELITEGVPVLYVQDIKPDLFCRISSAHVTEQKANELAFCNVRRSDVLVAKVGSPPCDSCVYGQDERAVVTQDVIRVRPTTDVNPLYLAAILNSAYGRKAIKRISIEGTRERVSLTEFKRLVFPIATTKEQSLVECRVGTTQAAICAEFNALANLKCLKLGLTQDLLTGKVPVKVDMPEAAYA